MNKAIVLLSGGLDSTAIAAFAIKEHDEVFFLHTTYGQNTAAKELDCFNKICDFYHASSNHRLVVDIAHLGKIGGSSLTDDSIKVTEYQGDNDKIPSSYVPFRNTHILSTAVSWAEVIGAKAIYIGANEEDSPGYPDCRPAYYDAFNELIKTGTKEADIKVKTPIIHMTKKEIIEFGMKNSAPFELSWSCYKSSDIACGVCDSCALRLRGFKELNLKDVIQYS